MESDSTDDQSTEPDGIDENIRNLLYGVLAAIIAVVIMAHRLFPTNFRLLDIAFAGDHFIEGKTHTSVNNCYNVSLMIFFFNHNCITYFFLPFLLKDTHALRMLQSRLGASFTTAVPFIFAVLVISVFSANNLVTVDGLKPNFSIDIPKKDNTFKYINIQISSQAFVAAPTQFVCDDPNGIQLIDSERAPHLKCVQTTSTSRAVADNNMVSCAVTFNCSVDSSLSGVQDVMMAFPTAFQVISWHVAPSTWEGGQNSTNISHVLNPTQNNMLVGNDNVPTVLEFSVSRAKYLRKYSEQKNTTDYGLKLTWNRIIREESEHGVKEATHLVAFRFNVADTIYVKEISMKLATLTRFGTVLTLLLTAMSSMKLVKVQLQRCIDHCIKTRAQKNRVEPAEDVLRRERVLDEHAITNVGAKMRRLSSRSSNKTKPERKRRLSSRELMKQETLSGRESSGIELTIRNGDNDARVFDNPMKNSNGPSSLARGDVALKTKVEALMKSNIELKKSNIELKMELKNSTTELKNSNLELKNSNIELKNRTTELKNSNMELQKDVLEMKGQMAMLLAGSTPNSKTVVAKTKTKKWKSAKNKLKSVAAFKERRRSSLMTSSSEVNFVNNVHFDVETGRHYRINPETEVSEWLDSE